jgi:predicted nucleic acid-binding protein
VSRVVADTNILVSALQFGGKPKHLVDLAIDGQIDLAVSEAITAETLRVLRDKFGRIPERLADADRLLRVVARLVTPSESLQVIEADPSDDRILECAGGGWPRTCRAVETVLNPSGRLEASNLYA